MFVQVKQEQIAKLKKQVVIVCLAFLAGRFDDLAECVLVDAQRMRKGSFTKDLEARLQAVLKGSFAGVFTRWCIDYVELNRFNDTRGLTFAKRRLTGSYQRRGEVGLLFLVT